MSSGGLEWVAYEPPTSQEAERLAEFIERCEAIGVNFTREQALELIELRAREIARPKIVDFLRAIFARFSDSPAVMVALRRALGLTSADSLARAAIAFQVAPEYLAQLHREVIAARKIAGPSR